MNPPEFTVPTPRQTCWIGPVLALLLLIAALPVALALGVWSCLRTSSDSTALREAAAHASGTRWERQVEFSAGSLLFALGRFGLGFAPLDLDARLAIKAVRRAEVAVFQAGRRTGESDRSLILTSADAAMSRRGWDRLVGVINDEDVVAVYVPDRNGRGNMLDVCVLVVNEENLVVASGRADLDTLLQLVERHRPDLNPLLARKN